ncbi:SDR family oxidoreductase [Bradyrhizobium sp. BR 10289]|uniref:dTDP-4-dehydrorhamnose reductase family protein n=1 Tax=Bradyrhizobium sp. BR 10289 TaxID=2749993 RepID=UPI001C64A8F2|nr:SDR family oxidoreductase [Bradyrhizobium sp. BR 10289]MBW7970294.1 SDR family oxidoreductase [Bradyrhizobium sp. BR 10289]
MKILVLGASGMLGHTLFNYLGRNAAFQVFGTCRSRPAGWSSHCPLIENVSAQDTKSWRNVISDLCPELVINCIGVIKQLDQAKDPVISIKTNALFPHELFLVCRGIGARVIHFSTDCVFSGSKGNYVESDIPDPIDLYGRTKLLGEIEQSGALTLRTSIIGHGIHPNSSLIDWFLAQQRTVPGYVRAIYTGLPTIEVARVVQDFVVPHPDLNGLYHLGSEAITKFDLLKAVAAAYEKDIEIVPDENVAIDRSLDSKRFQNATGYRPPNWPSLVTAMREHRRW